MKTRAKLVTSLLATLFAVISLVAPGSILPAPAAPAVGSQAGPATKTQVQAAANRPVIGPATGPANGPANAQANALANPPAGGPAKAPAKMVDGWLINQTSKLYGEEILTISAIGIKATNPKTRICLIMTPPFELVTLFNERARSVFQTPIKSFRCPVLKTFSLFNSYEFGSQPMIKVGVGNLLGFNVVKYQTTKAFSAKQAALRNTDKVPSSNPLIIDSQSTDAFHLGPGAGLGLCRLYGLPLVPGIPLQVDCKDLDLSPSVFLKTQKLAKIKVSTADFALPLNYKRVKSVEETSSSDLDEDAMQLFGK